MDEYEAEERKQAAAKALLNYSQFVMSCIGEDARPGQMRLHLMKEVSGMPTHLNSGKGANADKGQTSSQPLGIKESLPKSFVRQDLSKG
ncbi:hypothetical protein MPTK1_3g00060 [Marchantia polymorpha subsp. ruderalis]|nr:hypothetical protein Mp_3g00060 [Marchantia polymorpha subsp. ruderalis]